MTIRTSKRTVSFRRPFVLGRFDEVLPAGPYSVETDEELLEGISFTAYRQLLSRIHLHAKPGHPGRMQTLTVDPNDLNAALKRDQAPTETTVGRHFNRMTLKGISEPRRKQAGRQAVVRIEDEGMTVDPR